MARDVAGYVSTLSFTGAAEGDVRPVDDPFGRVEDDDAVTEHHALPIGRQLRQIDLALRGQRLDLFLQSGRKLAVALELFLQTGGQGFTLGEAGRQSRLGIIQACSDALSLCAAEDTIVVLALGI